MKYLKNQQRANCICDCYFSHWTYRNYCSSIWTAFRLNFQLALDLSKRNRGLVHLLSWLVLKDPKWKVYQVSPRHCDLWRNVEVVLSTSGICFLGAACCGKGRVSWLQAKPPGLSNHRSYRSGLVVLARCYPGKPNLVLWAGQTVLVELTALQYW